MSFHDDHVELRGMIARFSANMTTGPGSAALLDERLKFARLFARHNREELASMQQLQLDHIGRDDRAAIDRCSDLMLTLRRDYSAHIYRWTPEAIDGDWAGYGIAVRRLQQRLLDLLDYEETHVLPLIEGPAASFRSAA